MTAKMQTRPTARLLAVAVLASAGSAGCAAASPRPSAYDIDWRQPIDITRMSARAVSSRIDAMTKLPAPTPAQRALFAASLAYQEADAIAIKPRVYASFRPACGNTGGKLVRPDDCTAREVRAAYAYSNESVRLGRIRDAKVSAAAKRLLAATEAAVRADPTLQARLLEGGQPACGNTMSKTAAPSYCAIREDRP